jgi:hypothetical protein
MDLDLAPPVTKQVRGTVRDGGGQPVEGAVVVVATEEPVTRTTTDGNGRFTIAAEAGAVIVVGSERGTAQTEVPDDDAKTWDVELTVEPGDYE